MKRRPFAILAVLSTLLCATLAVSWARSHHAPEAIFDASGGWQLVSADRRIAWYDSPRPRALRSLHQSDIWYESDIGELVWSRIVILDVLHEHGRLGFAWWRSGPARILVLPHAALMLLFAVAPASVLSAHVGGSFRRASKFGCCVHCGYDLRATPERCPECGTPAVPGAATEAGT